MRKSHECSWVDEHGPKGDFWGINLGCDFVSEHEWGIKEILNALGVTLEGVGIEARKTTIAPDPENERNGICFVDDGKHAMLIFETSSYSETCMDHYRKHDGVISTFVRERYCELSVPQATEDDCKEDKDDPRKYMCCAWDSRSFGIVVALKKNRKRLRKIYDALMNIDAVIGLSSPIMLNNSGLVISIASKIPDIVAQDIKKRDEDQNKLKIASDDIGIVKRLEDICKADREAHGNSYYYPKCGVYACSPKWAKDVAGALSNTKYDVVYWLNPRDQQKNNSGWFTVENLEAWIDNKGPIPKIQ